MRRYVQIGLASLIQPRLTIGQERAAPFNQSQRERQRGAYTDLFAAEAARRANYGYSGPGKYKLSSWEDDLSIRNEPTGPSPGGTSRLVAYLSGPDVSVFRDVGNGWFEVAIVGTRPDDVSKIPFSAVGYLCIPCEYGDNTPYGTMLVRQDVPISQPFQAQPQTSVPLDQARPGIASPLARPELVSTPLGTPAMPGMAPGGTNATLVEFLSPVSQNGLPTSRRTRLGQVVFGQRDIGFPVSPVSRRSYVPGSVPTGPVIAPNAPIYNRLPEQTFLTPETIPVQSPVPMNVVGTYRVIAPRGLRAVVQEYTTAGGIINRPVPNLLPGTILQVTGDVGGGWLSAVFDEARLLVEAPGGAGLERVSTQPGQYPAYTNPNLTALNQGRMYANRINRPIGPSIRGYGRPIG